MPVFIGYPLGFTFAKFQYGGMFRIAAEDAVGRGEELFQLFRIGLLGILI